jgi:hypothetical protein
MKGFVKYITAVFLSCSYLLASTGFGVHVCHHTGSADLLIINSDKDCTDIHKYCSCNSQGCKSAKHDGNCCETDIHHLDTDAELVTGQNNTIPADENFLEMPSLQLPQIYDVLPGCTWKMVPGFDPLPPGLPGFSLPLLSQWRL